MLVTSFNEKFHILKMKTEGTLDSIYRKCRSWTLVPSQAAWRCLVMAQHLP